MRAFNLINVIIENLILLFYAETIFKRKQFSNLLKVLICIILIGVTTFTSSLYLPAYMNLIISFIAGFSVMCIMFEGMWKKKFFMTAIYMVVIFSSDILATAIITLFGISYEMSGSDNITFIVGAMLSDFIRLWLLAYIGKILSGRVQNLPVSYWIFLFVCPVLSILCLVIFDIYLMQVHNANAFLVFTPSVCILYINFMVFHFFGVFSDWLKLKISENLTKQKEENYKILQNNEEELRALRHDMKNHIITMNEYLKNNDTETAMSHLQDIQVTLENISSVVNTGNAAIDAAVNIGMRKAQAAKIDYKTQIQGNAEVLISAADICSLLSNAIDNAIEGCANCHEKYVYIEIHMHEEEFKVHIENSTVLNDSDTLDVTSKQDKKNHGYGLKNMKSITKKYGGIMNCNVENETFYLDIILKNKVIN